MALELEDKIDLLAEGASFDLCNSRPGGEPVQKQTGGRDWRRWIYPAVLPGGRTTRLFKVLLTNACENNCLYCASRRDSNCARTSFRPEELANLFLQLQQRGRASGLFLSSGLAGGGNRTMERMLAAAEIVRRRGFRGYIHLKILPGAERAAIERAIQLADRVSVNLEAPGPDRLQRLSAEKRYDNLEQALRAAAGLREVQGGAPAGITTQFVVGAAGESDAELLGCSSRLYGDMSLARAYYSGFRPLAGTPLAEQAPTPASREVRLYQADFLLRAYGYEARELVVDAAGNLPLQKDPKQAWADAHPESFPIEVNKADRAFLLRVPGVGPQGTQRILAARRECTLRSLDQLRALGIATGRAAPYVLLDGRRPERPYPRQLALWESLPAEV
ncbi:MAG: radical SAM protein [Dehalococcoidales bacterium]|nr:radical SAM protein [Dehalococcoidales bacterium]